MPLRHVLEINAITRPGASGAELTAVWTWPDGALAEADARDLADTWVRALDALARHGRPPAPGRHLLRLRPGAAGPGRDRGVRERLVRRGWGATMKRARIEDVLPLTALQEGFLFHSLYDERAADVYHLQLAFALRGSLDAAALRRSCAGCCGATPICGRLQARRSGESVQVVLAEAELPWREVDLSDEEPDRRESGWPNCSARTAPSAST
ncbi:condensation domain-containing protein [Streptomyces sp. M19]